MGKGSLAERRAMSGRLKKTDRGRRGMGGSVCACTGVRREELEGAAEGEVGSNGCIEGNGSVMWGAGRG